MLNLGMTYPIKANQEFNAFSKITKVVIWVCTLWAWATVLEYTSPAIDVSILLLTAPPALFLFWYKPEYGLIAMLFFGSGFLAPNLVDIRLPLLGGFELRDLILLLLLLMSLFRSLARGELRVPWWPVGGLLLAFLIMMLFSLFHALFLEHVPGNWALGDTRILMFYSSFFITAWSIRNREAFYTLVIGCFVVADITAAIVLIQQHLGPYNLLLPSMTDGSWNITMEQGSTRVVPPGIVFMYMTMLMSLGLSFYWRVNWFNKILLYLHAGFLAAGLIFTFTRSAWIASIISILVLLIVAFPDYKRYVVRAVVLITASLLVIVWGWSLVSTHLSLPDNLVMQGIVNRFTSIFTVQDTVETNSIQWRSFEIQEASKAIARSPFIGVGLGNSYRNITAFQGEARGLWTDGDISYVRISRFTRYVHSSYWAIAVKMGIPALLLLLGFCFAAMVKSIPLHYHVADGFAKGLILPIGAGMVGLLQWSTFHANLILAPSTIVIGLLTGLLATIHYLYVVQDPRAHAPKALP
jgi:hypothetical protein